MECMFREKQRSSERHTMAVAKLHFLQLDSLRLPVSKYLFINWIISCMCFCPMKLNNH